MLHKVHANQMRKYDSTIRPRDHSGRRSTLRQDLRFVNSYRGWSFVNMSANWNWEGTRRTWTWHNGTFVWTKWIFSLTFECSIDQYLYGLQQSNPHYIKNPNNIRVMLYKVYPNQMRKYYSKYYLNHFNIWWTGGFMFYAFILRFIDDLFNFIFEVVTYIN